jgi:hypothetical protein
VLACVERADRMREALDGPHWTEQRFSA